MLSQRQSGLVVVKACFFLHEADLARALLESYGIEAWILDEHQIRQQWHLAGALGGVKVAVAPECAYRARQVLEEDYSDVVEEVAEADSAREEADARCARCGGPVTRGARRAALPRPHEIAASLLWGAAFLVTLGVVVPRRRFDVTWRCSGCGHAWTARETG
jgi:hypothetical protein